MAPRAKKTEGNFWQFGIFGGVLGVLHGSKGQKRHGEGDFRGFGFFGGFGGFKPKTFLDKKSLEKNQVWGRNLRKGNW